MANQRKGQDLEAQTRGGYPVKPDHLLYEFSGT